MAEGVVVCWRERFGRDKSTVHRQVVSESYRRDFAKLVAERRREWVPCDEAGTECEWPDWVRAAFPVDVGRERRWSTDWLDRRIFIDEPRIPGYRRCRWCGPIGHLVEDDDEIEADHRWRTNRRRANAERDRLERAHDLEDDARYEAERAAGRTGHWADRFPW